MRKVLILPFILGLAGCDETGNDKTHAQTPMPAVQQLVGPVPYVTSTPANSALQCVAQNARRGSDLRIGVGDIVDGTGARIFDQGQSPLLTQRPDMMFAVALKKAGIRTLNRNSTKVSEWEMAQAMEKRLGDGAPVTIDDQKFDYRPVVAGEFLGTTHYVSGALTEANWNIYSDDKSAGLLGVYKGKKTYYISVAVDLMITDTRTTEITMARSYTKQIAGVEISNGIFRFFEVGNHGQIGPLELFDASSGKDQNEPVQLAVRWLIESAAYDMVASLTNTHKACDSQLTPVVPAPAVPVPTAAVPAKSAETKSTAHS